MAIAAYYLAKHEEAEEEKVYRVGILCGLDYIVDIIDSFKEGMAGLGYVEGENIVYDVQRTNFEPDKEKQILEKFVKERVDLIFTFPTEVSMLAKEATLGTNIPVVFSFANIEDTGLVDSVSQPGGNITGVRYPGPDLAVQRFEILQELAPEVKKILVPFQRGYPIVNSQLEVLRQAADQRGITLIELAADNAAELEAELAKLNNAGIEAVLFLAEPLVVTEDAFLVIARFASENRLPIGGALMLVDGYESLFGVNVDLSSTGWQAAALANKIFNGFEAGSIPVVSSEPFFQLNYKEAQNLGLKVSEGLLSRTDEIIR